MFLDGVLKFGVGFGVIEDDLLVLLCELLIVELCHVLVHVLAASIGQVLLIDESALILSKLHQTDAQSGVAHIQKNNVPHLDQRFQLLQPLISIACSYGYPVIHQSHWLSQSYFC